MMLCFVLDLHCISPPLLTDLKQSLLQLANFYAISAPSRPRSSSLESLCDRIGLCYLFRDRISGSDEMKIAYKPSGNFSLRDFHCAVNSLPSDTFAPEINESGAICCSNLKLSSVLSDRVLYSWGGKDIMRKVIVLSSCLPENINSETKNMLTDAADKCVSVEFQLLELRSSHLSYVQEKINNFVRCISDLDNCSFKSYLPDAKAFHGLVKKWLLDLKDDMGEQLQARFIFKSNLAGSMNKIFCSLSVAAYNIVDGFSPCQTCRCHGFPLGDAVKTRMDRLFCPVTSNDLRECDVIESSLKVGAKTVLFMSSLQSCRKPQQVPSPIDFDIIERTNLGSLSEGVIMGASYIVTPSACHEIEAASEQLDQPDLNTQLFQGLCTALYSMDQGLVCCSTYNTETMTVAAFQCYYILQPSENGPMLLRRLAGSEEVLPVSEVCQFLESSICREINSSVRNSLLKIELIDYNPLMHERGFHQKLNLLVKESLQFGSVPLKSNDATSDVSSTVADSLEETTQSDLETNMPTEEKTIKVEETTGVDKTTACIAEEWEQLVVTEVPRRHSSSCSIPKPRLDQQVLLQLDCDKQIDIKTSRILERLEVPRQMKAKVVSPTTITSSCKSVVCLPTKKPLIPLLTNCTADPPVTSSQLMKPTFQRPKRKQR